MNVKAHILFYFIANVANLIKKLLTEMLWNEAREIKSRDEWIEINLLSNKIILQHQSS